MQRNHSEKLYAEAKQYFPGGVNSPVRAFKAVGGAPLFIKHGSGCRITDVDDNTLIDFCCSWGPLILGHADADVLNAVNETAKHGLTFGTPTPHGTEIGKLIIDNHPYLEKLRFVTSGTEAVMSAIRLARGYTGKAKIIKFEGCYHGHVDSLLVKAGSGLATFGESTSAGVTAQMVSDTIVLNLSDLDAVSDVLQKQAHEIAAIIIEPIPANNGLLLQEKTYLEGLRKLCSEHDVLLIFDEVISGFRVKFGGAAEYYGVTPDLITFGKIIGGGMPVGAYGGKAEIMASIAPEGPVYQAGTLSANPVTLAAGKATLSKLLVPGFYENQLSRTEAFLSIINDHIDRKGYEMRMVNIGSIFWMAFSKYRIHRADQIKSEDNEKFKALYKLLLEEGIYLGPSMYEVGFVSAAHTSEDLTLAAGKICSCIDKVLG